jgi:MFS family permease
LRKKPFFYGWWIVISCTIISFWGGGAFYCLTCFVKPIVEEFGWTYLAVSLALSLRSMELGLLAPVTGFLADKFGPRKITFCSTLIAGAGFALLSQTNSLAVFYVAFGILSIGATGFGQVVTMTAVANWFNKKISRATGIVVSGYGAGGILMPLIAWLTTRYGWRETLILLSLATCVILLPISLIVRDKPEEHGYLPDGESPSSPQAWQPEMDSVYSTEVEFTAGQALKTRTFWFIGFTFAIPFMVYGAVAVHVMPCFASLGLPGEKAALVAMFIPLSTIVGRLAFGWLGDILNKKNLFAATLFLQAIGLAFFYAAGTLWQLVVFLVFFGPAYGGTVTLRSAILREYFGRRAFGSIQGLITTVMTVGGIVGPAYAGWVFDTRGSYKMGWLSFIVPMMAGVPVILSIKKKPAGIH